MPTLIKERLAIKGGKPAVYGPIAPFLSIGDAEAEAAHDAVKGRLLSGYLGGEKVGGYHVEKLEREWEKKFEVKHAVACNSATCGILIACMAVGIRPGMVVRTTPYTMSGTVAPAVLLGAHIIFGDIDRDTFCLTGLTDATRLSIAVNLFGHPCESPPGALVIEDAAQSIMARRNGKLASSLITVFSGNVHKAVQCGEGGMCVTDNDDIALGMRMFRNHGEITGHHAGLNLRLPEVSAAIWLEQLRKADDIVAGRMAIAEELTEAAREAGLGEPPVVKPNCTHSYYIWALKVRNQVNVASALVAEGVPIRAGYMAPLYQLPAFAQPIHRPIVEEIEKKILVYENCLHDPTPQQLKQIRTAFKKVADQFQG